MFFLDMLTPSGVPLTPFSRQNKISLKLCSTGSLGEYCFLACVVGLTWLFYQDDLLKLTHNRFAHTSFNHVARRPCGGCVLPQQPGRLANAGFSVNSSYAPAYPALPAGPPLGGLCGRGWIAGLPLISGPVSFTLEQGAASSAAASFNTLLGVLARTATALIYPWLAAVGLPWFVALPVALCGFWRRLGRAAHTVTPLWAVALSSAPAAGRQPA